MTVRVITGYGLRRLVGIGTTGAVDVVAKLLQLNFQSFHADLKAVHLIYCCLSRC